MYQTAKIAFARRRSARARRLLPALAVLALAAACAEQETPTAFDAAPSASNHPGGAPGYVYTSTNAAAGNELLVYERGADGRLQPGYAVSTGGTGTGAGLGSQGAVILSGNGRWVLVVNAGSSEISVFRAGGGGVVQTDRVASGGTMPISLTLHRDIVYVLNAGVPNNITGFRLSPHGELTPIPGSTRPLSADNTGPAQVEFTPRGDALVVTEKATNRILTFTVDRDGVAGSAQIHDSEGATPFGFAFGKRGRLVVSEAFGGAPNASALSSYDVSATTLDVISASIGTGQTAACWVVITNNGRLVFTTNTGSGTVSSYALGNDGVLELLHGVAANTGMGSGPIDMALSRNSRFAYVLAPGNGTLRPYSVESDGTLVGLGPVSGIPASAFGLAAT